MDSTSDTYPISRPQGFELPDVANATPGSYQIKRRDSIEFEDTEHVDDQKKQHLNELN
jgi:hypothetical protein